MQAVEEGAGSAGPVAVYCGSSAGVDPKFAAAAAELGSALAGAGRTLVYGGGDVGLMGIVADAAMDAGGTVIGVIPEHLVRLRPRARRVSRRHRPLAPRLRLEGRRRGFDHLCVHRRHGP
jgi:predicted Rossmann-fold nucleotide-binding protein